MNAPTGPVLLIMGSTRAARLCPAITQWVGELGQAHTGLDYETIDLAQWPLPMDDEPGVPAAGLYTQPHTRAWSAKVQHAAAVVLVTPQYNWGYPAILKNAIDHLYAEWRDKPALIISYGGHGGAKCAAQLRQVAGAVKMHVLECAPALTLPDAVIRNGAALDVPLDFASHACDVSAALRALEEYLRHHA
ncbi:NADPH-dependent FMN reductase [Oleiagrimonas sp. C23AA]|uniref:NADPH-dependent FMN reductase n=1 Tax=Oleiagrimonas sp. C23AA TaxID=2719047 RepID=UPI001422E42C|nr:NADPH-dependent FMN reductase [Oleiagrimonas sp. C23AA]NII09529.1 NAD(P)H-dependent oxidoreductase [Oleiagrimonas sp. C23AA]